MPRKLRERYEQARDDPTMLELRDEIALLDARLGELLERAADGADGAPWRGIRQAWAEFKQHRATGSAPGMQQALLDVEEQLGRGLSEVAVWREIGMQLDRRVRPVESESRRLDALHGYLTADEAATMCATLADTIRRNVTDGDTLAAISAELAGLVPVDAAPLPMPSRRRRH